VNRGLITRWDTDAGRGSVTGSFGDVHFFVARDCSPQLLELLTGKTIPPNAPIPVTFGVSADSRAFSLSGDDTTETK
jgi:hypothetical protein